MKNMFDTFCELEPTNVILCLTDRSWTHQGIIGLHESIHRKSKTNNELCFVGNSNGVHGKSYEDLVGFFKKLVPL